MKKHLSLVRPPATPEESTERLDITGPDGPLILTGPKDPWVINVSLGDPDPVVYVTFEFEDGRKVEITLTDSRADYVGDLLKKAHAIAVQRMNEAIAAVQSAG